MKKKYKVIMFDMDGTLVPMDMEEFTTGYFKELGKKLSKYGIEQGKLVESIWAGTKAMAKNDGSKSNRDVFWEMFAKLTGKNNIEEIDKSCLEFYSNEFMVAKKFTQDNELAKKAVELAHEKAEKVILASNPLFPFVGQITRMSWVNLEKEDFDLITCYESDVYCKPNPLYYKSICERIGVEPSDCLMIGNDENEDMYAATLAGIDSFLVTDCMIPSKEHPWDGDKGSFKDLINVLEDLEGK